MVKAPKVFEESLLEHLYVNGDVGSGVPSLPRGENGERFTIDRINARLRRQPFALCRAKEDSVMAELKRALDEAPVLSLSKALTNLPKPRDDEIALCCQVLLIEKNPAVEFIDAGVSNNRYYPPRMVIKLEHPSMLPHELKTGCRDVKHYSTPGMSFRINTGHVVRIPNVAQRRTLKPNGSVIKSATPEAQQPFIVMPIVRCNEGARIHVSECPIDPDNTGLVTVNFVLLSGTVTQLKVAFRAYLADADRAVGTLVDPLPSSEPFKSKDQKSSRIVRNPRVKLAMETLHCAEDGSLLVRTFSDRIEPRQVNELEQLRFQAGRCGIFVPRKREWLNPLMATIGGMNLEPRPIAICHDPKYLKNLMSVALIRPTSTKLFSEYVPNPDLTMPVKILNGAFQDLDNHKRLSKASLLLTSTVAALIKGYRTCVRLSKELQKGRGITVAPKSLMRIYDYHRTIPSDSGALVDLLAKSNLELWDSRNDITTGTFSVALHRAFSFLVGHLLRDELTSDELQALGFGKPAEDEPLLSQRPDEPPPLSQRPDEPPLPSLEDSPPPLLLPFDDAAASPLLSDDDIVPATPPPSPKKRSAAEAVATAAAVKRKILPDEGGSSPKRQRPSE